MPQPHELDKRRLGRRECLRCFDTSWRASRVHMTGPPADDGVMCTIYRPANRLHTVQHVQRVCCRSISMLQTTRMQWPAPLGRASPRTCFFRRCACFSAPSSSSLSLSMIVRIITRRFRAHFTESIRQTISTLIDKPDSVQRRPHITFGMRLVWTSINILHKAPCSVCTHASSSVAIAI